LAISFYLQEAAYEQSGEDERRVRLSRNSFADNRAKLAGQDSDEQGPLGTVGLKSRMTAHRSVKIEFENDLASTMLSLLG
jgi:hypothetical protein